MVKLFIGIVIGFMMGSTGMVVTQALSAPTCGDLKPQTDTFVRWAENQAQWHLGDVKVDPRMSPPIEAQYCGTKIMGRLYAVYIRRISP